VKNPIDSAMFIECFDFLTKEYNFIRKGSLFIRVVDNQMMQTVFPFKIFPLDIDINIGLYSVYEKIFPVYIKEGRFRLSELSNSQFRITDPMETLQRVKKVFIARVIPVFERVTSMEELMKFDQKGYYFFSLDRFIGYLKLGDLQNAYKILANTEKEEIRNLKIIEDNEYIYPADSIVRQKELIDEIRTQKRAIEDNDTDLLRAILNENFLNSKKMLQPYGIYLH
jgi:hypothetical protein